MHELHEREGAAPHVARLLKRDAVLAAAVAHITQALGEGYRLLLVHADTLDGSALNLALEEEGISLPFRSGPVELSHNPGSRQVLQAAADRTLLFGAGPLRVVCTASHSPSDERARFCLPVEGLEHLIEVECFFTVEQPTGADVSRILRHDEAIIDGLRLSLSDPLGEAAVLGELLRSARRIETVDRLLAHPGFGALNRVVVDQLGHAHGERIRQRQDLAVLRGQLTNHRRETAATLAERDRRIAIDNKILETEGDIGALMAVAAAELGVGLVVEDDTFDIVRSSNALEPPSLRSILGGRIDTIAGELDVGFPTLIRLGQPAAGSRLVMRLATDRRIGYLSIPLEAARETELQRAWLERLQASVTAARRVEVEMSEMVERVGRHVLREIASGSLSPAESRSAAAQLGWMKGQGASLAALSIAEGSLGQAPGDYLAKTCDRLNRGNFTAAILDEEIVVLCLSDDDVQSLEAFVSAVEVLAMGVSAFDDHPELAPQARLQASWAARLARSAFRTSLHFDEIGIHRLLLPGSEGGDAAFEEPIRLLEEQAAGLTFDPLETLRVYLDSGASPREAAESLNVHVNTLRYRIKRLSTLSEIDLSDPEKRFQADLALRLRMARRAFGSTWPDRPTSNEL